MSNTDAVELIRRVAEALTSAGLVVDDIDLSGELVRCGTTQKPNGTDGAYAVHLDKTPLVWLSNWHDGGIPQTVYLYEKNQLDALTEAEREALRERIRQEKEENALRLAERRRKAADAANDLFRTLSPAGQKNAYLSRKGVLPLGNLRECDASRTPYPSQLAGACLVVPLLNSEGRTVSLQFIDEAGSKRFLPGGEKRGCYFPIPAKDGSKDGPLLIGEGVATVLSACMATGYAGLVAFDCGNLEAAGRVAREKYPERELVFLADNDCTDKDGSARPEEQNPGLVTARKAAEAVGGKLAVCPAHEGRSADFNDLHQARGLDAVRMVIEKAREACAVRLPDGFSSGKMAVIRGCSNRKRKEKNPLICVSGRLSALSAKLPMMVPTTGGRSLHGKTLPGLNIAGHYLTTCCRDRGGNMHRFLRGAAIPSLRGRLRSLPRSFRG